MGVWVWAAMLGCDVLAAAFHIFHSVQFFDGAGAQWWKSARREFKVMAGLVMAMFADTGAPLAPCVYALMRKVMTMVMIGAATASLGGQ